MKELLKIDKSLEKLQIDFNSQIEALGNDTKEFHNAIIELSSKYPDHKELLQFIVFINDKLEINQNLFSEVVSDSFNELIKVKKQLVQKLIEEKECEDLKQMVEPDGVWAHTKSVLGTFKNAKIILTAIAVIALAAGALLAPDMFIAIIKELAKLL